MQPRPIYTQVPEQLKVGPWRTCYEHMMRDWYLADNIYYEVVGEIEEQQELVVEFEDEFSQHRKVSLIGKTKSVMVEIWCGSLAY
jgi:hypothetical protein